MDLQGDTRENRLNVVFKTIIKDFACFVKQLWVISANAA